MLLVYILPWVLVTSLKKSVEVTKIVIIMAVMANMRHPNKRCLGAWVDKDLYLEWQAEVESLGQTLTERVTNLLHRDLRTLTHKRVQKQSGRGDSQGG